MISDAAPPEHRPSRGRPSPRLRRALLAVHLTTAVGLVGIALALSVLGVAGWAGQAPEAIYPAMHLLAQTVLVPLGLLALGVGIAHTLLTGHGLLQHRWITAKLVILTLLVVVAAALAVPGLERAAHAATTPGTDLTAAQQIVATATPSAALALFILATILGVTRPTLRRR